LAGRVVAFGSGEPDDAQAAAASARAGSNLLVIMARRKCTSDAVNTRTSCGVARRTYVRGMRPYLVLALAIASNALAQRKVVTSDIGVLYRYQGDTIWYERDSTLTVTICRGDTISTRSTMAGRLRYAHSYVIIGDSARLVSAVDSTGAPQPGTGRMAPARVASSTRDMLAMQLRTAQTRERMRQRGIGDYVPLSPPSPISYCIDGTRTMVQHADTVRDIRKSSSRVDTTVYVFGSDTTVRRLSPSPTLFGYTMYNTLVGDMHMSVVHRNLAARSSPQESALPGKPSDACNKR
jgi:hypothetical protein